MALSECLILGCLPISQPPDIELLALNDVCSHLYSLEERFSHCTASSWERVRTAFFSSVYPLSKTEGVI